MNRAMYPGNDGDAGPEGPRCPYCDEQMTQITSIIFQPFWECDNQECPENRAKENE